MCKDKDLLSVSFLSSFHQRSFPIMVSSRLLSTILVLVALVGFSKASVLGFSFRQLNPTINKAQCESCFFQWQCLSGVCVNRKCVNSLDKDDRFTCFQSECTPCVTRRTCASNRCFGEPGNTKCVKFSTESIRKCFSETSTSTPEPSMEEISASPTE